MGLFSRAVPQEVLVKTRSAGGLPLARVERRRSTDEVVISSVAIEPILKGPELPATGDPFQTDFTPAPISSVMGDPIPPAVPMEPSRAASEPIFPEPAVSGESPVAPPGSPVPSSMDASSDDNDVTGRDSSAATPGNGNGAPNVRRINQPSELPAYSQVLTDPEGEITISASLRKNVAAVQLGQNQAAIVINGDSLAPNSNEIRTLRSALRNKSYQILGTYIATATIFAQVSRASGDEKTASATGSADSVRLFDKILESAIHAGASDIHICVRTESTQVLLRVYGQLRRIMSLPSDAAIEAVGVAYNKMAVEGSRSKQEPQFTATRYQYCVVRRQIGSSQWRFRYNSVRAEGGFDVVLRVIRERTHDDRRSLESLGYEDSQREQLKFATMKAVGSIIVAGETGSGKSTTLNTLMTTGDNLATLKSYSVEDPVESRMFGVTQIPIQRDVSAEEDNAPLLEASRALLRCDPDVIMIGEVRDKDVADFFGQAVQSGHRVMTTVHATSAIDIIMRLVSPPILMPIETLTSKRFISALVYQTLLPRLCPKCSIPARDVLGDDYVDFIASKFNVSPIGMRVRNEAGCPDCRKGRIDGIIGQTVAAEIIQPDTQLLKHLRVRDDLEAELYWRQTRRSGFDDPDMTGKTAFEHALYKALLGMVDPRDIESSFESFRTYEVVPI